MSSSRHADLINNVGFNSKIITPLQSVSFHTVRCRPTTKDLTRFCFAGFFEMKMKYDESDNALIRASRAVTDKMTDLIGERLLMH